MILVRTRLGPSPIHGIGIFADQVIARHTLIWTFVEGFDLVLNDMQLLACSPPALAQLLSYGYRSKATGRLIVCTDDSRFFNHSPTPNTRSSVPPGATHPEALEILAAVDIFPGDELTENYTEFAADWHD